MSTTTMPAAEFTAADHGRRKLFRFVVFLLGGILAAAALAIPSKADGSRTLMTVRLRRMSQGGFGMRHHRGGCLVQGAWIWRLQELWTGDGQHGGRGAKFVPGNLRRQRQLTHCCCAAAAFRGVRALSCLWARARGLLLTDALLERLQRDKESRNKHDRQADRRDHAGENADPEGTARVGSGSCRKHQRQDAENKGKGGHEDWSEPGARRLDRRLEDCGVRARLRRSKYRSWPTRR